jgi:hypothetical protein
LFISLWLISLKVEHASSHYKKTSWQFRYFCFGKLLHRPSTFSHFSLSVYLSFLAFVSFFLTCYIFHTFVLSSLPFLHHIFAIL